MLVRVLVYSLAALILILWYRRQGITFPLQLISPDRGGAPALDAASPTGLLPLPGPERVAAARAARGQVIAQRCAKAGLPYPPRELFFRAFKKEAELEAWGREDSGEFRQIGVYSITASSGLPGPKRREGDGQVPEGCYRISVFNPESSFHLSLGLDYPNASDQVLSDQEKPGFDIYIHGGAASVGCLPVGDEAIEEVFLLASETKSRGQAEFPVHIFPTRMEGASWDELQNEYPEHVAFWKQLQPIYLAFQATRKVPAVAVEQDGSYTLR